MNVRDLPGKPDFANKRREFAIFVHGSFASRLQARLESEVEPELLASEA
jgi:G:T-mismatch repair DNA endonuclease (very short patch repair protein)